MITRGPDFLRQMANRLLDALVQGAEQQAQKAPFTVDTLRQLVESMKTASDYDHYYRASYDALMKVIEEDERKGARINAFGRLLVHPLDTLFAEDKLDRRLIGNYFFFVRSLFGDEVDVMAEEAANIAEELRVAGGGPLDWAEFYADPRVKQLYFKVAARVIKSFRVFETRKEWAMKVMQHDPTAVGISSNVYIERPFEGQALPFGDREFYLFFDGLIRPLAKLSPDDAALFRTATGEDAAKLAGNFLRELDHYGPF